MEQGNQAEEVKTIEQSFTMSKIQEKMNVILETAGVKVNHYTYVGIQGGFQELIKALEDVKQ